MRKKIKIYESGDAYLGKDLGQEFKGEADCYPNALTVTIVKPNTPLAKVRQSLEIVLADIKLREQSEE